MRRPPTATSDNGSPARPPRVIQLIERLLADGTFTEESLARELVLSPRALAGYRAGKSTMPLDRQLCFALLLIEKVPRAARLGHQLRGQVVAAMGYAVRTTSAPQEAPARPNTIRFSRTRHGAL
jgi:hypothetical protein